MALSSGTRLGSYEVVAQLGAGGMGEVYKARDSRLGRFVALKVLPEPLAASADALARFEREAKAVAALNHPNILGIHELGKENGTSFVVLELLEGESLRERLDLGPVPPRRAVELAIQMADGLAAAHEKGVVHRDLKPDNLWVTRDGRLKILDFGLAKQLPASGAKGSDSIAPTEAPLTEVGRALGTLGYMSPEQVRGEEVDSRSDLFSFGTVLYEMLAGRRAFQRGSDGETFAAILRDDPPDLEGGRTTIAPALQRLVRRCLEKSPEQRFQSARDLGFALRDLSFAESESRGGALLARMKVRGARTWAAAFALLFAGALGWALRRAAPALPAFRLLTHERGTVSGARFVSGVPEVIYSAQWSDGGSRWYSRRLDQSGAREVVGSEGLLLALSPNGEGLGISRPYLSHAVQIGTLYSLPLSGGAQHEWVSASVWGASPGAAPGEIAAAIGEFGGEIRLEWPLGHVVAKGVEVLRSPAVRGDLLAYVKGRANMSEDVSLELVDRNGKGRSVAPIDGFTGLAWGPSGKELWVSTFRDGESVFYAVDLSGKTRTLLRLPGRLELQDVDANGRVLAALHSYQRQTFARGRGDTKERDLGWLEAQATLSLTDDGRLALLAPLGDWSNLNGTLYVRPLSGEPARLIGPGHGQSTISGDGKWVVTSTLDPALAIVLQPTGAGAPRRIPVPAFQGADVRADLLPDGKTAILWGSERGAPLSFYAFDLESGALRRLAPPNSTLYAYQKIVSPDGLWLAYLDSSRSLKDGGGIVEVCRTDGTGRREVLTLPAGEAISNWGPDDASLIVWDRNKVPTDVERVDFETKRRTRVLTIAPADPVGIPGIQALQMTPDGAAYTYNVTRKLSELYLIEGLR